MREHEPGCPAIQEGDADDDALDALLGKLRALMAMVNVLNKPENGLGGSYAEECYSCQHRRDVPGDAHISCAEPDAEMVGNLHGIKRGWFMYPFRFDPVWKAKPCANVAPKVASASPAVSPETRAK